jgi:CTP:molybdopterin cytidylyltransferase MocA
VSPPDAVPSRSQIAAVILAAGSSTRLGHPKQSLILAGETLLARAIRIAIEAGLTPVIAVLNDSGLVDPVQRLGALPVLNPDALQGISTSIHSGIRTAKSSNASGAVLMTCDQVALTAAHLRALCDQPATITGSGYAGRTGSPAYFPASSFEDLFNLQGDVGARTLLRHARTIPCEALSLDIDTEEDLEHARKLIENKQLP